MYEDDDWRATTVRTRGTKYAATVSGCTVTQANRQSVGVTIYQRYQT